MIRTLSNAYEIVQASGISKEFPVCDISGIHVYEREAVEKCIGADNYELLLDALNDYSSAVPFEIGQTFAIGETAIYNGFIYESLANGNTAYPSDHTKWELAPKFSTTCYNELWCGFLLGYIARSVMINHLETSSVYFSSKGAVERYSENSRSASDRKILLLQRRMNTQIESFYNQMVIWLKKSKCLTLPSTSCTDGCGCSGCETGKGCNKKRSGWRVA